MIKSLFLKNWKSFASAQLWVDPLTFIIGTNSAGKSNIVDALNFFSFMAAGNRFSDSNVRGGIEGMIKRYEKYLTLIVTLILGKEEFTYDISLVLEDKELLLKEERLTVKTFNGKEKTLFFTEGYTVGSTEITAWFQKDKPNTHKGI